MEKQYLTLPFKKSMIICGYKNEEYRKHWKYPHYGIDITTRQGITEDPTIIASGSGEVIDCGWDNSGGNIVIVKYPNVFNCKNNNVLDVIIRYLHLESIAVKKGDKVKQGDKLGNEGKTKTSSYHLHLEIDTDTKYPYHSPQVSSKDDNKTAAQGNILKHGTDTSINPADVLFIGENQELVPTVYNKAWLSELDIYSHIPADNKVIITNSMIERLRELHTELGEILEEVRI